jgi:hypothetical protein
VKFAFRASGPLPGRALGRRLAVRTGRTPPHVSIGGPVDRPRARSC